MLRWAEVKTIIREIIGLPLVNVGFPNPGVKMWRVRDEFIDSVAMYMASNTSFMNIEFGCHPRRLPPRQPTPVSCLFRTSLFHTVNMPIPRRVYELGATIDEQRQKCDILAPLIVEGTQRWFTHFVTSETAIKALGHNTDHGITHVTMAKIGSPEYACIMNVLQSFRVGHGSR